MLLIPLQLLPRPASSPSRYLLCRPSLCLPSPSPSPNLSCLSTSICPAVRPNLSFQALLPQVPYLGTVLPCSLSLLGSCLDYSFTLFGLHTAHPCSLLPPDLPLDISSHCPKVREVKVFQREANYNFFCRWINTGFLPLFLRVTWNYFGGGLVNCSH